MSLRRAALLVMVLALLAGPASNGRAETVEPPRIGKPRPAPDTPPNIPPLPPAYYDGELAVGGDDLKARKIETRLSVPVHVNGRGPYDFIVDSGADTSVVGLRIARDLELPLGTPAILNGMTSRNIVDRVKVEQLAVGTSTFHDLQLPALSESHLGGEGMLGIDALVSQRLMLDFDKKLIKIEDARIPWVRLPNEIVVVARRVRGQLILTRVQAAGLPLEAVIDTGSQITIGNLALRDRLIRGNRNKFTTVPVTGVTGAKMKMQLARIDELKLGPVTIRDVPMAFADVPPFKMFGLQDQPALLLGTDLLESFRRVSLDFRARKVRFQLRRCGSEGISIRTSPGSMSRLSATAPDVCGR